MDEIISPVVKPKRRTFSAIKRAKSQVALRSKEPLPKCDSAVYDPEDANLRKHTSREFAFKIKDHGDSVDALKTLGERLAEIDSRLPDAVKTGATQNQSKVILKPIQNFSLMEFANTLKDKDMPLSCKLIGLTNSLCPASGEIT